MSRIKHFRELDSDNEIRLSTINEHLADKEISQEERLRLLRMRQEPSRRKQ